MQAIAWGPQLEGGPQLGCPRSLSLNKKNTGNMIQEIMGLSHHSFGSGSAST